MRLAVMAGALLLVSIGFAEGHEISEAYAACLERAKGVHPAMHDCIAKELEVQDRRLNAAYDLLMTLPKVTEERRAQLRDVQRKWVAFRDANCAYYDDPSLGQAARLAAHECMLKLTHGRAFELEILRPE